MKFNNRSLFLLAASALLAASLLGCGGGSGSPTPVSNPPVTESVATASSGGVGNSATATSSTALVSFSNDVLPILNNRCSSCHSGPMSRAGVDLSSYDSVMNSQTILPGDAQNSLLVQAVEIGQMPRSGEPLTADQIQTIANWVKAGAQNN
jgi:uncharacterized membrane protein